MTDKLISTSATWIDVIELGEFDVYSVPNNQPTANYVNVVGVIDFSKININHSVLEYYSAPLTNIPYPNSVLAADKIEQTIEFTAVYIYSLYDAFFYNPQSFQFDLHIGSPDFIEVPVGTIDNTFQPLLRINGDGDNYAMYQYQRIAIYPSRISCSYRQRSSVQSNLVIAPNYICLANGYYLDSRIIPEYPEIVPDKSETITIKYYQKNPYESIPNLTTIEWREYEVNLIKNQKIKLPIYFLVLGTLQVNSNKAINKIIAIATQGGFYSWANAFEGAIPALFVNWNNLYETALTNANNISYPSNASVTRVYQTSKILRRISANNNYWNQANVDELDNDLNSLPSHPMFVVDNQRAYDWHIAPQLDNDGNDKGRGNLLVDSIRTIEIHQALNAGAFGDGRKWNLGEMVYRIARVLGLRRKLDGTIDRDLEQKVYLRKIRNSPKYNKEDYSATCMGEYGRLTPHLSNQNGDKAWDVTYDLFQMLEAVMEHVNRSLGVQQGTEIKIKNPTTGKEDYYPNQFALLLEIYNKLAKIELDSKESFNLVSIIAQEIKELFSGIGIPITFKTLFNRYGNLPFIGHQFDKGSIQTSLNTLKINVGIVLGNMLTAKSNNPLMKFIEKVKGDKK